MAVLPMAVLRVALLQTASAGANPTENLNRGLVACRTAAANTLPDPAK
jgi:hypothetical protein